MMKTDRPLYSRDDLPALKTRDRAGVFEVLGSFDSTGMAEGEFVPRALGLLDPDRVPGLGQAIDRGDHAGALAFVVGRFAGAAQEEPPPALSDEIRRTADDALVNRFSFYGETHALPEGIDWDFNPGTAHWGHDLNRFTYLGPLCAAYRATGDERYSRHAIRLMLDWIAKCDFTKAFVGTRYAFGSYLNLAIHIGAWASAVRRLAARGQLRPIELLRILKSMQEHLAYLEIVTNRHVGNWPTIGCFGMLQALEHLPVLRETARFAVYCRDTLARQVNEQVLPDGVQDELTPHYHLVVVRNLISACRSLRALGLDLAPRTLETLRAMARYTQQATVPDGSRQVAFNDSDPGCPTKLAPLLEPLGLERFLRPTGELGPEFRPCAGVAFLRQRADRGDLYLAFDVGPYGRSHQHEDKLGFWLFAYGRSLLVDPGRHLYDTSAVSYYGYLRSTRAHSTILVDGQGQNSAARRDTWIAKVPIDGGWERAPGEIRASGSYDLGYGPTNDVRAVHRREIVFVRERFWVVFDVVAGEGEHLVESRFQFAPGPLRLDGQRAQTEFADSNLLVWPAGARPFDSVCIEEGQESPRGGWYSDSYNKIEPAPALSLSVRAGLPLRLATLLLPYRGTACPDVAFQFDGRVACVRLAGEGDVRVGCRLE